MARTVVMEAVASGTPVLASRVDGNIGMLGPDYAGCFPWGDAEVLAALILCCYESRRGRDGALLQVLAAQWRERASLCDPQTERSAVRRLFKELLCSTRP
jgi:glycosyltransferase involved in cell wall biosynthesis